MSVSRTSFGVAVISAVFIGLLAPLSAQTKRPAGRAAGASTTAPHPKFKAIFEPVNYAQDVEFTDVFFVDKETGWACGNRRTAAGEGGFIIGTRDGGKTWALQLGDPDSSTRGFAQLFFLDATHGWATQFGGKMLRTTDGSTWEPTGEFGALSPFVFISPDRGFFLDMRSNIQATVDGGRTWKPAYHCQAKVEVQGLPHEQECEPQAIAFAPDHLTGYVLTNELDNKASAIIKTTDGGGTWTLAPSVPDTSGRDGSLVFTDPSTGFLRAGGGLQMTSDGGQTWHRLAATIPGGAPKILFAGPVGWLVEGDTFSYTTDGGKHWNARDVSFPTGVVRFSLPAPDTGYVVGTHGMVYRYRVVPFDYAVPNMIAAPAMGTLGPGGS
jgi:photosystem II stability/assembly factor-like uncharacterized protein